MSPIIIYSYISTSQLRHFISSPYTDSTTENTAYEVVDYPLECACYWSGWKSSVVDIVTAKLAGDPDNATQPLTSIILLLVLIWCKNEQISSVSQLQESVCGLDNVKYTIGQFEWYRYQQQRTQLQQNYWRSWTGQVKVQMVDIPQRYRH